MATIKQIHLTDHAVNSLKCYALTPIESMHYKVATHRQFDDDIVIERPADFEKRWREILILAKQNMPSVLVHTTEIRALITMLENPYVISMVQSFIEQCHDTRKGFLYFLESDFCRLLPLTARAELFSFVQMLISPRSYYYPNVELLICRNVSLLEFLMIGHCQLDGFIFDGAMHDSHAVIAAKSIGKQVILTDDDFYIPFDGYDIEVVSTELGQATLLWQ